jgi:hypothetical protein
VEDLRKMIGQNIDLNHRMPIAIEVLEGNPLASGDFYPGNLMMSVLAVDEDFLQRNRDIASKIVMVAESAIVSTESMNNE